MKRLKRLWCHLRGHDEIKMSVGANYVRVCLRCDEKLEVHEE